MPSIRTSPKCPDNGGSRYWRDYCILKVRFPFLVLFNPYTWELSKVVLYQTWAPERFFSVHINSYTSAHVSKVVPNLTWAPLGMVYTNYKTHPSQPPTPNTGYTAHECGTTANLSSTPPLLFVMYTRTLARVSKKNYGFNFIGHFSIKHTFLMENKSNNFSNKTCHLSLTWPSQLLSPPRNALCQTLTMSCKRKKYSTETNVNQGRQEERVPKS